MVLDQIGSIVKTVGSKLGDLIGKGKDVIANIGASIKGVVSSAISAIKTPFQVVDDVKKKIKTAQEAVENIKQVVHNVQEGIQTGVETIKQVGQQAIDPFGAGAEIQQISNAIVQQVDSSQIPGVLGQAVKDFALVGHVPGNTGLTALMKSIYNNAITNGVQSLNPMQQKIFPLIRDQMIKQLKPADIYDAD